MITNITANINKTIINKIISHKTEMVDGPINDYKISSSIRDSKISWINEKEVLRYLFNIINEKNQKTWLMKLTDIEPIQYAEYGKGSLYNWHRDIRDEPYSNGLVRKISFSIILDDIFTGGEFDIDVYNPSSKKRFFTFDSSKTNTIIFHSNLWHRVRPVKSGIRKSIVGWVLGPA